MTQIYTHSHTVRLAYIILGTGNIDTSSLHSNTVDGDEQEREGNSLEGWSSSFTCTYKFLFRSTKQVPTGTNRGPILTIMFW